MKLKPHLTVAQTSTRRPIAYINAHRLWACRGMPFDDVCQIPLTRRPQSWVVKGDAHQKILRGRGGSREPSTFYQFLPSGLRSILTDLEIHP